METVKNIEWSPKWDAGAPLPQVFSNGQKVYLIYNILEDEIKELTTIKSLDEPNESGQLLALVEFRGHTFRFGIANDEVFEGMPLYKYGLTGYAHIIENSKWIEEVKQIHKIHPYFEPARWVGLNHYALLFKDEILEVIATDYKIEVFNASYQRLGIEVLKRMNIL